MASNTNPSSASAARWTSSTASVNSLAMTEASVEPVPNSDFTRSGLLPMTIATAMVSPSARPSASSTAPTKPVRE